MERQGSRWQCGPRRRAWPVVPILVATLLLLAGCAASNREDADGPGIPGTLPARPNIVIILVDTLRADAVGFGGARRDTSPRLDAWARRGVVFEQATTPAGWTRTAVISLFTGLFPAAHGVQDKDHVAPDSLLTLAEVLRGAGWRTAAFVSNFAVAARFGTAQGFDTFRFFDKKEAPRGTPSKLNYLPIEFMDPEVRAFLEHPPAEPFFAYIHTTDPHFPYLPPPEYLHWGTEPRDRYDGEVLYTDRYVGEWLDAMKRSGVLGRSIVVFTADHGEEFHEHGGTGHGVTVFEECVRIPLVVWAPGLRPGRRRSLVSLVDVPPTLLEAAHVPAPEGFAVEGRSLWPMIAGGDPGNGWNWNYSELVYPSKGIAFTYREGDEKVVHIVRDKLGRRDWSGLYDVSRDPFQQRNLAAERPDRLRELREKLRAIRRDHLREAQAVANPRPLDGEALEQLRSLGYVD